MHSASLPPRSIGIDIGGTNTRAGFVDAAGRATALVSQPTIGGEAGVVEGTVHLIERLLDSTGIGLADVDLIGVGMPGLVDPSTGRVTHGVNLGLDERPSPIRDRLAGRLGRPVWVGNDVNAAALGATLELDGRDAEVGRTGVIAYLSIGTGIAAAWVHRGHLWTGSAGAAGEIGHISIDPNGPPCGCGQRGCVEAICSGSAITRRWPTDTGSSTASLLDAAAAGQPAALAVWNDVAGGLASAVNIVTMSIDPDLIVPGGGIAAHGAVVVPALADALRTRAQQSRFLATLNAADRLRHVQQADQVGVIGAVLAASNASS